MADYRKQKISLIITLFTLGVTLFIIRTSLDPFIPKHVAIMHETLSKGEFQFEVRTIRDIPAFYSFGTVVYALISVKPSSFIFIPIQLLPFSISLFGLIYCISRNFTLSTILVAATMGAGTMGTQKILLWPHGLGKILLFCVIIIYMIYLREPNKRRIFILSLPILTTLVLISYNETARALLTLFALIGILLLQDHTSLGGNDPNSQWVDLLMLGIVSLIVFFTFSHFFIYFISLFVSPAEILDRLSGLLSSFLIVWIGTDTPAQPIDQMRTSRPAGIRSVTAIKYVILYLSVFAVSVYTARESRQRSLKDTEVVLVAATIGFLIYMLLRTSVGAFPLADIYYVGILSLSYILVIQRSSISTNLNGVFNIFSRPEIRYFVYGACAFFLFLGLIGMGVYSASGDIRGDDESVEQKENAYKWTSENIEGPLYSDEFSRGMFVLFSVADSKTSVETGHSTYPILPKDDAVTLAGLDQNELHKTYYLIDYDQSYMSLQGWHVIRSWQEWKEEINRHTGLVSIYSDGSNVVYKNSSP